MEVTIVTVRDIFQDEAGRKSRFSDEYKNLSALIILDKQDMGRLAAKDGQKLLVKNDVGSVVVAARTSEDDAHPGLAFMYNSPWSNQLVSDDVCRLQHSRLQEHQGHDLCSRGERRNPDIRASGKDAKLRKEHEQGSHLYLRSL